MLRKMLIPIVIATIILSAGAAAAHDNWPQFRGPNGAGICENSQTGPIEFGLDKNVMWKSAVPPGLSSPCVWGERIFVTACHADEKKLETICLHRDDGRVLWRAAVAVDGMESVHKTSSPANATACCDGERVYVYFGSFGLLAYHLDGTKAWEMRLPVPTVMFGSGTSPIIAGDLLVLNRLEGMAFGVAGAPKSQGEKAASETLALERRTGKVAWRTPMRMLPGGRSHATPAVVSNATGVEIIVAGGGRVSSLNAANGKLKWWTDKLPVVATATPLVVGDRLFLNCTGLAGDTDPVTPITFADALKKWDKNNDGKLQRDELPDDLALFTRHREDHEGDFAVKTFFFRNADKDRDGALSAEEWDGMYKEVVSGWAERMKPATVALRLGGEGDVTKTHCLWTVNRGVPEVPSILAVGNCLYAIRNGGLVTCLAADTGKVHYEERLGASGSYYASPISDGKNVYFVSQPGVVTIVRAGDKFERLARIDLKDEVGATPALVNGRLYIRTGKHLMAFGSK